MYGYNNFRVEIAKHMDKTKIDSGQGAHYVSVHTKFGGFILIHEAMNAENEFD